MLFLKIVCHKIVWNNQVKLCSVVRALKLSTS